MAVFGPSRRISAPPSGLCPVQSSKTAANRPQQGVACRTVSTLESGSLWSGVPERLDCGLPVLLLLILLTNGAHPLDQSSDVNQTASKQLGDRATYYLLLAASIIVGTALNTLGTAPTTLGTTPTTAAPRIVLPLLTQSHGPQLTGRSRCKMLRGWPLALLMSWQWPTPRGPRPLVCGALQPRHPRGLLGVRGVRTGPDRRGFAHVTIHSGEPLTDRKSRFQVSPAASCTPRTPTTPTTHPQYPQYL